MAKSKKERSGLVKFLRVLFVLVLAAMLMLVFSLIFWKKDMFR